MENERSEDTHPATSRGHAEDGPGFDNERRNSVCNRPTIIWEPLFADLVTDGLIFSVYPLLRL